MALSVQTNVASLTAQRNLSRSTSRLNTSLERLSTGLKINKASDSASGLVISETQKAEISGLEGAIANIDRAVNFTQTAESAMGEISDVLIAIRSLTVDSLNSGAHSASDLAANQAEIDNLLSTIDDVVGRTKFGSLNVFTNSASIFQTGAFSNETASFTVGALDSTHIGTGTANATVTDLSLADVTSAGSAAETLVAVDAAINQIVTARGDLGAFQKNTLQTTQSNLRSQLQNLQEAESSLRDVDYQQEIAKFTNEQIRQQASSTVLGLANQSSQSILALLQAGR